MSIGYQAGYSNTSGAYNTNVGYQAGKNNTTSQGRTMIGDEAGTFQTGSQNTGIGRYALRQGTGLQNTAVGHSAMVGNMSGGSFNTVLGYNAMSSNGAKNNNVVVGTEAGRLMTTGSNNVVLGYQAMDTNTDGNDNVAIGYQALKSATSDDRNIAIGYRALYALNQTFSASNIAIGYAADDGTTQGFFRTCIGRDTGRNSGEGSNITNIGYSAQESSNTATNEVTLGNSSVATLRCAVTSITSLSDERDKSEIKDISYGLDFIDSLQPREFVWDNRAETNKDGEEFYSDNKGKKDFGFIAQEVQSVDDDTLRLVYDENPDKLEMSYGKLVPVLVQAIKELKAEVELLKA